MTHLRAQVAVDAAPHTVVSAPRGRAGIRRTQPLHSAITGEGSSGFLRVHARLEHQLTRNPLTRILLATRFGHSHGSPWSHIRSFQTYDQEGVSASSGLGSAVGCLRPSISILCVPGRTGEAQLEDGLLEQLSELEGYGDKTNLFGWKCT